MDFVRSPWLTGKALLDKWLVGLIPNGIQVGTSV